MKISWLKFVILNSVLITCYNFVLFRYVYENLCFQSHTLMALAIPVICFFILNFALSLLLLPYLSKILSIVCILICSLSGYFMHSYGIIIDEGMIRNLFETDTKEAFGYLNLKFIIYFLLATLLPCLFVAFVRIDYGGFKRHLVVKFASSFVSLGVVLVLVFMLSKSIVPFFRDHNINTPYYPLYSVKKFIKNKFFKDDKFYQIALDATKPNGGGVKSLWSWWLKSWLEPQTTLWEDTPQTIQISTPKTSQI